jgi:hypothetical protein
MTAQLLSQRIGSTLVLTLSNPDARNALDPVMYTASMEAMDRAANDNEIRALIFTGADGVFCAGGNLNRLLENRSKPLDRDHPHLPQAGDRGGGRRGGGRGLLAGAGVRLCGCGVGCQVRDGLCERRAHAGWRWFVAHRPLLAAPAGQRGHHAWQAGRR